jgi:small ligand-binding sensory domain FIST
MRWSSTTSTLRRLDDAVDEAARTVAAGLGGAPADLAVAFVSPHHVGTWARLPALLRDALAPRTLVGCSAGGVIGGGREREDEVALSLTAASLPGASATSFHRVEPTPPPLSGPEATTCVLALADPFTFDVDAFLRSIDGNAAGTPVVGGLASGGRDAGANALFVDDAVHRSGAVGVVLAGNVAVDTIVAQGCRPIGDPMFVTRADRNVIHELDGRHAGMILQDLYQRATPADQALFRQALFLGIAMTEGRHEYRPGDFLVRNVLGMDDKTGALVVGALVHDGMVVQFHVRDAETSAHELDALLARYRGKPAGALLFSCLGRGRFLYGRPDHDTDAFRARVGDVPLGGFFCNGEIGPVQDRTFLHGYTSAFALFRPREA